MVPATVWLEEDVLLFNVLKGLAIGIFTIMVYKRLTPALKGVCIKLWKVKRI